MKTLAQCLRCMTIFSEEKIIRLFLNNEHFPEYFCEECLYEKWGVYIKK